MSLSRDSLSEALRELAANSPQSASPQLGASLRNAFARHHARRRQKQALVLGIAACLALATAWLWITKWDRTLQAAKQPATMAQPSTSPTALTPQTVTASPAPARSAHSVRPVHAKKVKSHSNGTQAPAPVVEAGDFVALPTFDPAIPLGESRVVRLDLPGPALQLIGYPVDGQLLQGRVLTDVLVGQDGMPYAVRLVQTRNLH